VEGTLEPTRARLIIQALRIAARNAKNVRFDTYHEDEKQSMVRQVPDYARQYLIEHPEFGPPISTRGRDTPVREAETNPVAEREARTTVASQPIVSPAIPATKRRKNAAHDASRGSTKESDPAPKERKKPQRETQESELERVQAAIAGAECGNWRDLRTVFEFSGISAQNKDAPS
jgi:hypothetical protein